MKYMGSKSRLAKDIVPIIQSYIDSTGYNYIEPYAEKGVDKVEKLFILK